MSNRFTRFGHHAVLGLLLAFMLGCTERHPGEPITGSAQEEIAFIDLYGHRNVSPESIRDAIGESPEVSEELVERLRAISGVSGVSLDRGARPYADLLTQILAGIDSG